MSRRIPVLLVSLSFLFACASGDTGESPDFATLHAFPGALGQGAGSTGGRGGDVYHVTNLLDYDKSVPPMKGSLRHGIESTIGPRTIVFDIGGNLELVRPLIIGKDNLTIAGQSAPGDGVTLWGYYTSIRSDNIIIRFLRFRCGDFNALRANSDRDPVGGEGRGRMNLFGDEADGLEILSADNVIVDHCSMSWSMDEALGVAGTRNLTVQNCLIGESLHDSFHHVSPQGYGSLLRGDLTPQDRLAGIGGFTFVRNLYAHNNGRNPGIGGQESLDPEQGDSSRRGLDLEFVNNVIYNWGWGAGHTVAGLNVRLNYLGNTLIAGGDTDDPIYAFKHNDPGPFSIYHGYSNQVDSDRDAVHDPEPIGDEAFHAFSDEDLLSQSHPFAMPTSAILPSNIAYSQVIRGAGACLVRDDIDQRIVNDVVNRKGKIIDTQDDVGGIVPLKAGRGRPDRDGDGIPDVWEIMRGLDPDDSADGNQTTFSTAGYTNLEVYLHGILQPQNSL